MAKKEGKGMKVVGETVGKPIVEDFIDGVEKPGRRGGAKIPPVLNGFESVGSVPQDIRDRAEFVVRTKEDIERMKEELKKEERTLLDEMMNRNIPFVPVIVSKWRKRIELKKKPESCELSIVDEGLDDAGDDKDVKKKETAAA
jgi:hypothetical protein